MSNVRIFDLRNALSSRVSRSCPLTVLKLLQDLRMIGAKANQIFGQHPDIIFVILPQAADNTRNAVKHFDDVETGRLNAWYVFSDIVIS